MKALKLTIYSIIPVILLLISVSAFSLRSYAYENLPNNKRVDIGVVGGSVVRYFEVSEDSGDVKWGIVSYTTSSGSLIFQPCFFSRYPFKVFYSDVNRTYSASYNNGNYVWNWSIFLTPSRYNPFYLDSYKKYLTIDDLINSADDSVQLFADFGLDNLDYVIYKDSLLAFNTDYYLNYYVTWSGSSNLSYPLTNVNFEIYGFTDVLFDNTDKSNGTLLSSGECSSPFDTRGIDLFNDVNINLANDYMKCVLYLTPFSDNYQGNASFIVFNRYRDSAIMSFGPFEIDLNRILRIESSSSGVGTIPVNPTDVIDGYGVSYIGDAPVNTITQSFTGTIYNDNRVDMSTQYNPIIYDNSNNITNYYNDNSTNITNNDYSTNITNNISKEQTIDKSKQEVYEKNVISFLSMLVTFITSMWTFALNGLQWLPIWSQTLVTVLFSVTGTVIIALGIFKLFTK